MGKLMVIEGLDGTGKATQTALLAETLAGQARKVRVVTFPNYKSDSSALVRMYLGGDFGARPDDVNAYAASAFYAVDRYAGFKKEWGSFYAGGGVVLADRYTTSNAIHQCSKLPEDAWEGYLAWLEDFEYQKLGIPAPDLVILLDVEPELSQKLLAERYAEQGKKDIHEQDIGYLLRSRKVALWCAEHLGWHRVVCSQNGTMRSREAIAKEIESIVIQSELFHTEAP